MYKETDEHQVYGKERLDSQPEYKSNRSKFIFGCLLGGSVFIGGLALIFYLVRKNQQYAHSLEMRKIISNARRDTFGLKVKS